MIPAWLVSALIFGFAYLVIAKAGPITSFKYGLLNVGLSILAVFITPAGASIYTNPKAILTILAGTNIISQALFGNPLKTDILVSILAFGLTYAINTGLVILPW